MAGFDLTGFVSQNATQNWEVATQIPKCVAVFATQKLFDLPCIVLQNYTNLESATQIQICVAVFATHKQNLKSNTVHDPYSTLYCTLYIMCDRN